MNWNNVPQLSLMASQVSHHSASSDQQNNPQKIWAFQVARGWKPYDEDLQDLFNNMHGIGTMTFEVDIRGAMYKIDLINLKQTNKTDPSRIRAIKHDFQSNLNDSSAPPQNQLALSSSNNSRQMALLRPLTQIASSAPTSSSFPSHAPWTYEGSGNWWPFDDVLQEKLEAMYFGDVDVTHEMINGELYEINLKNFMQTNCKDPSKCRRIRRGSMTHKPKKSRLDKWFDYFLY